MHLLHIYFEDRASEGYGFPSDLTSQTAMNGCSKKPSECKTVCVVKSVAVQLSHLLDRGPVKVTYCMNVYRQIKWNL